MYFSSRKSVEDQHFRKEEAVYLGDACYIFDLRSRVCSAYFDGIFLVQFHSILCCNALSSLIISGNGILEEK